MLPLSVYLEGEYGQNDIYIGAPAIINRQGVKQVIEIPLTDAEQRKMEASASALKKLLKQLLLNLKQKKQNNSFYNSRKFKTTKSSTIVTPL